MLEFHWQRKLNKTNQSSEERKDFSSSIPAALTRSKIFLWKENKQKYFQLYQNADRLRLQLIRVSSEDSSFMLDHVFANQIVRRLLRWLLLDFQSRIKQCSQLTLWSCLRSKMLSRSSSDSGVLTESQTNSGQTKNPSSHFDRTTKKLWSPFLAEKHEKIARLN